MYTDTNRQDDFDWFVKNYHVLYMRYGISYIAIQNHTVLGTFKDITSALNELDKQYKRGEYILQFCNGDESGYTITLMRNFIYSGI